jgi:hypothetical protein
MSDFKNTIKKENFFDTMNLRHATNGKKINTVFPIIRVIY